MILYILLAFIVLPIALIVVSYVRNRRDRALIDKIPGPKSLPVLGSTVLLKCSGADIFDRMSELCYSYRDSGIIRLWFGNYPSIVVYEASAIESLCCSSKHLSKAYVYSFLQPWLGTGLLTSTGDKWKSRRKMITPAFHFKILEEFVEVFNEQAGKLVSIMDRQSGGTRFDIQPLLTKCTLDVIGDTAMGYNIGSLDGKNAEYVDAIYRLSDTLMTRFRSNWLWPNLIFKLSALGRKHDRDVKILHDFTSKVIQERRIKMQNSNGNDDVIINTEHSAANASEDDIMFGKKNRKQRLAFLDLLLSVAKDDPHMTDRDIQEEVDTFMFEGHDTTSAAACWIMYTVSSNTDVQKRLHEELDSVIGRDEDRPITIQDLSQLKYMECVIKETMRLYPAVPFISREISEDCEIGGYSIPKGTIAAILSNVLHRDPKQFPNPDVFDPDRWLDNTGRHPYSFIPFSAGLRNCIGQRFAMMEEKMILSHILRKFEMTCEDIEVPAMCELVMRPKYGLNISVKRRNSINQCSI